MSLSRRTTLKLMTAEMAAVLAGCSKPAQTIVPYVRMPEGGFAGHRMEVATTLTLGGVGRGVVVTTYEGRPIKVEGNALHPASLGATDVFAEAAVLSLYDPDRSRTVRHEGAIASWEAFGKAIEPLRTGRTPLRILTGPLTSPTARQQIAALLARTPGSQWHVHDPLRSAAAWDGSVAAFGRPVTSLPRLDEADVVVALAADPLGPGPAQILHARAWADRRRAGGSRLYVAEPTPSITGAKADHRWAMTPDAISRFAAALAAALGVGAPVPDLSASLQKRVAAVAGDLQSAKGRALVLAGPVLPAANHATCHAINAALAAPITALDPDALFGAPSTLDALLADARAGQVGAVLVAGCNPGFDAAALLGDASDWTKIPLRIHLGPFQDETAALCQWHLPESHPLETWSDARGPDGTISLVQPLIDPLYDSRTLHELLETLSGGSRSSQEIVRATFAGTDAEWRQALHDGVVAGSALPSLALPSPRAVPPPPATPGSAFAVFAPDPTLWDGTFANNAWLQECPAPLTKEVWGRSIGIAKSDAERLGIENGDAVRVEAVGASVEAPARIVSGQAPGIVALPLGFGRRAAGRVGTGVGVDVTALRGAEQAWVAPVTLAKARGVATVPVTAPTARLEGADRDLFPVRGPDDAPLQPPALSSFLPSQTPEGPQWGMVIDTDSCIGCNACVVACQVENNGPVIGPDEIRRGRDMHWLRIDTYDVGERDDAPVFGFQPIPCMHCEHAPCEPVCPVAASVHDHQGLNVQVYNRCIGTRFCEANCPYKVRRFNFFGYADGQEWGPLGEAVVAAHNNPDVTVRARGVMEKCTYCVQRITRARITADREDRPIAEGEVVTACQAACPTRAVHFGDITKPDADVSAARGEARHYALLGHLGTRPRTTYLAALRNTNAALRDDAE